MGSKRLGKTVVNGIAHCGMLLVAASLWIVFAVIRTNQHPSIGEAISHWIIFAVFEVAIAFRAVLQPWSSKLAFTISFVSAASGLNWVFATWYWLLGTPTNFGQSLTKLDAVYFTIATFTTTGYGDIAPLSQGARALVTAQMICDAVFVLVLVAMFVTRLSSGTAKQL